MAWFKKTNSETSQKSVQCEMNEREIAEQEALLNRCEGERRATENDLNKCKENVRKVEDALRLKRDEYEKANGNVKRIVVAETKGLADLLERQRGEQNLVLERLNQYDVIITKCRETIQGLRGEQFANVAVELATRREEVEEQRRRNDAAINALERVGRRTDTEEDDFDVEALFSRLDAETKASKPKNERNDLEKIDAIIAKAIGKASYETL